LNTDDAIDLAQSAPWRTLRAVVQVRVYSPSLRLGVAMTYRDDVVIQRSW
jgi:hypothetical protein